MVKKNHICRFMLALMGSLVGWWLFTAGYYLAFIRAEKEKIEIVRGDIKLKKYAAEEIRKGNTAKAIETLQGMAEVNEAYIRATHQVLDELTIFSFAVRPEKTISLIFFDVTSPLVAPLEADRRIQ